MTRVLQLEMKEHAGASFSRTHLDSLVGLQLINYQYHQPRCHQQMKLYDSQIFKEFDESQPDNLVCSQYQTRSMMDQER